MKTIYQPTRTVPLPVKSTPAAVTARNTKPSFWLPVWLLFCFAAIFPAQIFSQTNVRYNQVIQGGATIIGTSWFYSNTVPGFNDVSGMLVPRADPSVTPTTAASTYADLILPSGSTIVAAYLSVERTSGGGALTSVDIKVPGSTSYTTINSGNWGTMSRTSKVLTNTGYTFYQDVFNITSLITTATSGYGTTVSGSSPGRFYVAKPIPAPDVMGGWSIIFVYANPLSKYRSVTVADNWQVFFGNAQSVYTDVNGVKVPASGTVNAVVGVTGTYGDRGANYKDYLQFGTQSGALTYLTDPMGGTTDNALNSSVAMTVKNNVTQDIIAAGGSGYFTGGNVTTRNPISKGHPYSNSDRNSESWEYDADIFDASGILPASSSPVDVRFQQYSTGSDVLASGSYFVSVDLAVAPLLTKTLAPSSIPDGGTATYTWVITNTGSDAIVQSGLGFTDNLPSAIRVAAAPAASIIGGMGGTVTAVAGSGTVTVAGLTLNPGQSATIKVNITNLPGQRNASCGNNPGGFTNSASNITAAGILNASTITPQCLIVTSACNAGTTQVPLGSGIVTNVCPANTANLNSLFTGTAPSAPGLVWFTNNTHSGTAYATPTTAGAGTYYAFFYDAANNCYNATTSTAVATVVINPCANLSKIASPLTFADGGTTTYTWVINNSNGSAVTGFGFTDALPASLRVAAIPNITTNGFSTIPTITATAGAANVVVGGGAIAAGATATISITITNVPGQLNASCPNASFTNAGTAITGLTGANNQVGAGPCVTVTQGCAAAAGTLQ